MQHKHIKDGSPFSGLTESQVKCITKAVETKSSTMANDRFMGLDTEHKEKTPAQLTSSKVKKEADNTLSCTKDGQENSCVENVTNHSNHWNKQSSKKQSKKVMQLLFDIVWDCL